MRPFYRLPLYVCLLAAPALAQSSSGPPLAPLFDVGVSFVNDYLASGQNGASIGGTYFLRWDNARHWGGLSRGGIVAKYSGTGDTSMRLYTYTIGLRWGVEWRHFYFYSGPMIGGSRADARGLNNAGVPVSLVRNTYTVSTTTGVELLLGEHYAVKIFEVDFAAVTIPLSSTGRGSEVGDERTSAGIVYRFGRRHP